MIESIAAALAGRAAAGAASALLKESALSSDYLFTEDSITLLHAADEDGLPAIVVNDKQRVSIEHFLERPEIVELFQAWCLIHVGSGHDSTTEKLFNNIATTFDEMCQRWNAAHKQKWHSLSPDLWKLVTATLRPTVDNLRRIVQGESSLREIYERYSLGARLLRGPGRAPVAHIQRLAQVLANPRRLLAAPPLIEEICHASMHRFGELQLGHAPDVDDRFDEALLYVERTVINPSLRSAGKVEEVINTEDFTDGDQVNRVVIIGDPGVGKSTLVRHTIYQLSQRPSTGLAPLLVNCRDYAAMSWSKSIPDFIVDTLGTDLSVSTSAEDIADIFILGAACVVFDGVDEILDLKLRREFIRRVEAFALTYPYVTIISSSRKIGYTQARFHSSFRVVELDEFSSDEVNAYIQKWFKVTNRDPQEAAAFVRESEEVRDIRTNPLMLSLLCTLYRARGHIPRNRRQVYRDCADLLFQRWDAMRHIPQPFDHRQYGNRLMQELARFYYRSQTAQGGVEEEQLVRLISHFFRDSAAVDPPEDEVRARQFLDFCAGRAWLLSRKGTNARGARLFAFTHRTFMEYMAAESLVRNAKDIAELATEVLRVFESDPSSVIPDVMVQAADDKFEKGAEQTLQILAEQGRHKRGPSSDKFLALILRIVNSSPMSRNIASSLPGLVMSYWNRIDDVSDSPESTLALFELYRDPRSRVIAAFTAGSPITWRDESYSTAALRGALSSRWLRIELAGRAGSFDPDWRVPLQGYLSSQPLEPGNRRDPVVQEYLLRLGKISQRIVRPTVCLFTFYDRIPGSVTRALEKVTCSASGEICEDTAGVLRRFEQTANALYSQQHEAVAYSIGRMLAEEVPHWNVVNSERLDTRFNQYPAAKRVLWWLLCLTHEALGMKVFHRHFGSISLEFEQLAEFRTSTIEYLSRYTGDSDPPFMIDGHAVDLTDLKRQGIRLPEHLADAANTTSWSKRWNFGLTSLVEGRSVDLKTAATRQNPSSYLAPFVVERWSEFLWDLDRG